MLIPESGKPADLDIGSIKAPAEADRALLWLAEVLDDMKTQVRDRGGDDVLWLKRLRAAQRQTNNLRHRVLELRDSMAQDVLVHQAIVLSLFKMGDTDFVDDVAEQVRVDYPHLAGIDIRSLQAPKPE